MENQGAAPGCGSGGASSAGPEGAGGGKTAEQAQMLANRLRKRLRHLGKWARRAGAGAFRLYDRDIPEIPLALDVYIDAETGEPAVSGALYKRPYEKSEAEEERWLCAMREAAAQALGIGAGSVILKLRQRQPGLAQYERLSAQGITRIVSEGGLRFRANLSDYLDTGLFLDRRAMRRMVGAESSGRRALNLFCYTASFSVFAAAGGAASTDSVDLSNTYLRWAQGNFALNGLDAQICRQEEALGGGGASSGAASSGGAGRRAGSGAKAVAGGRRGGQANRLIRADVSEFLEGAAKAKRRWDLIVADPPAFSNSAMARRDFDLLRDHRALLASAAALLAPGGRLWFSACARSFRASAAELQAALEQELPGISVKDISAKAADEDFKGRKTPKAFIIERPLRQG